MDAVADVVCSAAATVGTEQDGSTRLRAENCRLHISHPSDPWTVLSPRSINMYEELIVVLGGRVRGDQAFCVRCSCATNFPACEVPDWRLEVDDHDMSRLDVRLDERSHVDQTELHDPPATHVGRLRGLHKRRKYPHYELRQEFGRGMYPR